MRVPRLHGVGVVAFHFVQKLAECFSGAFPQHEHPNPWAAMDRVPIFAPLDLPASLGRRLLPLALFDRHVQAVESFWTKRLNISQPSSVLGGWFGLDVAIGAWRHTTFGQQNKWCQVEC